MCEVVDYSLLMRSRSSRAPIALEGERVLILSAGVGSGHNSAAEAVRLACADRSDIAEVQVLDVLQTSSALYRNVLGKGYFVLAEELPWLVEWGYDFSDKPFRRRGPIDPWTRANALPVIREIKRFKPSAIVCTHFLPAQLVASLLLHGVIDAKTAIVTTDYDFQGLSLTGAFHALFVAREEAKAGLAALGLPADRVTAAGIPVAKQLEVIAARDVNEPPMLLISAGATGGDYTLAVVQQTLHMQTPFTATVICGRNDELRQRIEKLVAPAGDRYRVLGFTTEMPQLMRSADVFLGKPGGMSSAECMAAGLPMVLVNPIPGQEVRNGDYLIEQGAAVRCNTAATVGWKIDKVLSDPGRLQRMQDAARKTGRPDAAADVINGLLDGPSRPLVVTRAAQKTILAASQQRIVASDLTGPSSLVSLIDTDVGSTVALLQADELGDLQRRYSTSGGDLVLRRDKAPSSVRWEERRVLLAILRGDDELCVSAEELSAPLDILSG